MNSWRIWLALGLGLVACNGKQDADSTIALVGISPTADHEGQHPGVLRGGRMAAVAIDPNDGNHAVAVADAGGVYVSTDGGKSWEGSVRADGSPGAYGHGFAGTGIVRFYDVAIGSNGIMVLLAGPGAGQPQGVWRSTDGGKHWMRPVNPAPDDPINDPARILFSATPHMVYATVGNPYGGVPNTSTVHQGSKLGISMDDGATFTWIDPITTQGKFGWVGLHRPLAGLDVYPPSGEVENVFGEKAGGGASDVLVFCARMADQRRQVVFYNVHDGAVLTQDAPPVNGTVTGGYCQPAFDQTLSRHVFVASNNGSHEDLAEGRVDPVTHTMTWYDLGAPEYLPLTNNRPNGRPVFVQVHTEAENQLAVFYHNSGKLYRAHCKAANICGTVDWTQAKLPMIHPDSSRVAFFTADACPAMVSDDGGIELGVNCGDKFDADIAGLHAQEMHGASFAGSGSLTTVFLDLQDNGTYFLAHDDGETATDLLSLPWYEATGGDGYWSRTFRTDRTTAIAGGNFDSRLLAQLDHVPHVDHPLSQPPSSAGTPLKEAGERPSTVFVDKQVLVMPYLDPNDHLQMYEMFGGPFFPVGDPSDTVPTPSSQPHPTAAALGMATAGETEPGGSANVFVIQGLNFWLWDQYHWTILVPESQLGVWGDSVNAGHAYSVGSNGTVWRTAGGALVWKKDLLLTQLASANGAYKGLPSACGRNRQLCSIAFDPDHPGTIAAGTAHSGILVSHDDGASWSYGPGVPEPNGGVIGLYFDPGVGPHNESGLAAIWGQGLWAVDMNAAQIKIPNPLQGGTMGGLIYGADGGPVAHAQLEIRIVDQDLLLRNVADSADEAMQLPEAFPPESGDQDGDDEGAGDSTPKPFDPVTVGQELLQAAPTDEVAPPPPGQPSEVVADFMAPTPTSVDGVFDVELPKLPPGRYFVEVIFAGDEKNPPTTAGSEWEIAD